MLVNWKTILNICSQNVNFGLILFCFIYFPSIQFYFVTIKPLNIRPQYFNQLDILRDQKDVGLIYAQLIASCPHFYTWLGKIIVS